ncbi:MAG: RNA 2',3'-cyclic phosphodiesterase [Lacipirellulaceae bacterium]
MSKTRTFVAIEPEETVCRRVAALVRRLGPYSPQARWVDEENAHLTLAFLGELADREVSDACAAVEWAARANEPFEVRLAGVGAFPDLTAPRAVWLGVTEGAGALVRLQADVEEAVADFLPRGPKNEFRPHLTLARLARSAFAASGQLQQVLAGLGDHDAGVSWVDSVTVFASELRRSGPEYTVLARSPLGLVRR